MTKLRGEVAVLAAGGAQGSAIAAALSSAGVSVRRVARSEGPGSRSGSLADPVALAAALEGADIAVFTLPLNSAALAAEYAENVATAAHTAGVSRIVFNTNTRLPDQVTDAVGFESRRAALAVLAAGSVPVTTVEPAVYLDNLLAPGVFEVVDDGLILRYPVPADLPVSWITIEDLARTVAAASVHGEPGQVLRPGPPAHQGDDLAAALSRGAGVPVRFESLNPDHFEAGLASAIGPGTAAAVASIYRWLTAHPDSTVMAAPADQADQPAWMPPPTDAADWARLHLPAATARA